MPYFAFSKEIEMLIMVIRRHWFGKSNFYTHTDPAYKFMHSKAAKNSEPEKHNRNPNMKAGPEYDEVDLGANVKRIRGQELNDYIGPNKVLDEIQSGVLDLTIDFASQFGSDTNN